MNFDQTGLPDRPIFRASFDAGWERHSASGGDEAAYLRGPVAMARLVQERGGDCRQAVAAACLAGPAAFSENPDLRLDKKILSFAREIMEAGAVEESLLPRLVPMMSSDARLFLQASAVLMLDGLHDGDMQKTYIEALDLYSAARGTQDTYRLDTRFEIAAMKVTTLLEDRSHIWVRVHAPEFVRA